MSARCLLCSCDNTQTIDPAAVETATGLRCWPLHTALCGAEAEIAAKAIADGETIIACGQEKVFFDALADDLQTAAPLCVDIRDRAGWSADDADKTPKIAALMALAQMPPPAEKTMDVASEGMCLILGRSDAALDAAELAQLIQLEKGDGVASDLLCLMVQLKQDMATTLAA